MPNLPLKPAGISSAAVLARTGRTWPQWLAALDRAGARKLDHRGIVTIVGQRFGIGPWWRQMVTVGYEQARGLRVKHQTAAGFQVSASRTIAAPAGRLFLSWTDARRRTRWLPAAPIRITTRTPSRSLRAAWGEKGERLEVYLYPRPGGKTQVTVNHVRLTSASAARKAQAFWRARLTALASSL